MAARNRISTPEVQAQLDALPEGAGVYLFLDGHAEVIYVGKSIHLRNRARSYFHQRKVGVDIKHRRLVNAVRSIRHYRTSSELIALLLEDLLIKQYNPFYNSRQKKYKGYQYLQFSDDPFPKLVSFNGEEELLKEAFGPYPNGQFVERLGGLLGRYLGLRNCHEAQPGESCIQNDLGACLAPCVNQSGQERYPTMIRQVRALLRGESKQILEIISLSMKRSAQRKEFESAARSRDDLLFAQSFLKRQAFTRQFSRLDLRITDSRKDQADYHFNRGNLVAIRKRGRLLHGDKALIDATHTNDRRLMLDRAQLVESWLRKNAPSVKYEFELFG